MSDEEKDISAEVKAALPNELTARLGEVEKVLGKAVVFFEVPALAGGARGGVNMDGTIKLLSSSKTDFGVVGEELMHLHRWTSAFPKMNPLPPAEEGRYASALKVISGHFEEYAFFPFLEGLNLNPRGVVDAAMPRTARMLRSLIEEVKSSGETDEWRVILAALFVQAALLASGNNGAQVIEVFEDAVLQPYAKIGQLVCDEIVAAQKKNATGVKEHMERALFTHMRLKTNSVEVKPVY